MGRWTDDKKNQAREMILQGLKNKEISAIVGMSSSSISLLRYRGMGEYVYGFVECQVCHEQFRQITNKHLKSKHKIDLEEYKNMFPDVDTMTKHRRGQYLNFKHPNKGKTYDEIYGELEAVKKRNIISAKQIGRVAPKLAGTGITGTRKDTNTYARSTYEANIDRIFIFENKKYIDELSDKNKRFYLKDKNEKEVSYQPDRIDVDGLFKKGAYLEIKGYMYPEDWKKIQLFRDQTDEKLIVISSDEEYCDVNYKELQKKYQPLIKLWEGGKNNYKTRPDLYKIDYKTPAYIKYLEDNYPNHIKRTIEDKHELFILNKCLAYNRVKCGKNPYMESIKLIAISNHRPRARKSTGVYNYELWEVTTINSKVFYVTNQSKTVDFYSYSEDEYDKVCEFFKDNCDFSLNYGKK